MIAALYKMRKLEMEIEILREKMNTIVKLEGFQSEKTLKASQRLDRKVVEYLYWKRKRELSLH